MNDKKPYNYPLRLEARLKKPLEKMVEVTRWSKNDIINIALENYLKQKIAVHKIDVK